MSEEEARELTMSELRKRAAEKAKAEGRPTTELRTKWNRAQLETYLTDGTWHDVNTVAAGIDKEALGAALVELLEQIGGKTSLDPEEIRAIIKEEIAKTTKVIKVERWDGEIKDVGRQHKAFPTLLKLAGLREDTLLVGPAGSGKTTCVHKVADALGLTFYCQSVGMQTTKTDLIGYKDANGIYQGTILYQAYKNGGIYLLDEVDSGNANTLTILNALLANSGYFFPNGEYVPRHENFICFAAANTYGRGADRLYVGRNQLDAATLDRFAVVDFDYDEELEREWAGNDDWTAHVQKLRKAAFDLKERVVISPRASIRGAKFIASGGTWNEAEELYIWKGVAQDIRLKISANC